MLIILITKSLGLSTNDILQALNINEPLSENIALNYKKFSIVSSPNKALSKTLHNFKVSSEIVQQHQHQIYINKRH